MSEEKKESVADQTDAEAEAQAQEAGGAQEKGEDLDTLLSQFETAEQDSPKSEPEQQDDGKSDPNVKHLAKQVEELNQRAAREKFEKDMAETVQAVRGDLDSGVFDDATVEGWLEAQARRNPRLQKAWVNRHQNPQAWGKVVNQIARDFQGKFSKLPDKQASEDKEAVANAVRGASNRAPSGGDDIDPQDVAQMSDAEFEKFVRSQAK